MNYPFSKGLLVRKIKDFPGIWYLYKIYTERKLKHRLNPKKQVADEVFSGIYKSNDWNNDESVSGVGSSLLNTKTIVKKLPLLFKKYQIKSILDAPCGDFNWMQHVNKSGINYIGGDIVQELVDLNNTKFQKENINFIKIDIINDSLPKVDLMIVRDCLIHFNDSSIFQFINNISKSEIKYLLTTNFPLTKNNYDITMGNFRFINLLRRPYNFPKEIDILSEESKESYGQCPDKSLYLWDMEDIRLILFKKS
jgi:2-polyprenyl-3-methyl-5-hydroxy-6-metoxy-1,4-benzoquinol methylase